MRTFRLSYIFLIFFALTIVLTVTNFNSVRLLFSRASPPSAIDDTPVTKSVFLLIFNPILENQGSVKLTTYKNWQDPDGITNALLPIFPQISNGYLSYTIAERQEIDGFPTKSDGFVYDDASYLNCLSSTSTCHSPDIINYQKLFTDYSICSKDVDEVWLWGGPYFGYWEYHPVTYCGKTTFVMGFSYERTIGEALHNFGHRMEFVGINRLGDGNWQQNEANEWNKYSLINGHCGNIHYPPGTIVGAEEYKYDKTTPVSTDCDGYLSYPTGPFIPTSLTCNAWGCSQEGFIRWWLTHIPKNSGSSVISGKDLYHNWWKYFVYYDETFVPPPTPVPGTFSNLQATFNYPGPATFAFSYSGTASSFSVDVSTVSDMSTDVYLTFTQGSTSPLVESNPTKWDKYSCGRALYWRVRTSTSVQSGITPTTVYCPPTPTPTLSLTSTPTPTPVRSFQIINPNGGETLIEGQQYTITWNSTKNFDAVHLFYSDTNGFSRGIAANVPDTGLYVWPSVTRDDLTDTKYKIGIIGFVNNQFVSQDKSDDFYTFALPTPTPTPTPIACNDSDIDRNGTVDLADLALLKIDFLTPIATNPRTDINKDGIVDLTDYSFFVFEFGKTTVGCL